MKIFISNTAIILGLAIAGLTGCSKTEVKTANTHKADVNTATAINETSGFEYISMEGFSHELGKFVGLKEGETFAESETKINAVFKAYDGHVTPQDIRMNSSIVEAGWKQVLVTQDGLMDGTVTGQQLLAVFDENKNLVSYGMRIKCHSENGAENWQKTICE